jgi:hypothetical protein
MNDEPTLNPDATGLVDELEAAVLQRFPDATFEVRVSPDGRVYFTVYTEEDNDFAIQDLVAERTLDAVLACRATVHVMPRQLSNLTDDITIG